MPKHAQSRAEHYLSKAHDYDVAASLCEAVELRTAFRNVAASYRALADSEEWLAHHPVPATANAADRPPVLPTPAR
jgi:hypothetical protein